MTHPLEKHAHPASPDAVQELDVLSEVLQQSRLRGDGAEWLHPEMPFRIALPGTATSLYFILGEGLILQVPGQRDLPVAPSDIVLVRRGLPHVLSSVGASAPARPLRPDDRPSVEAPIGRGWITGYLRGECGESDQLEAALPAVVHIPRSAPENEWIMVSERLLLAEIRRRGPGSQAMISRILDLVFIHALRRWASGENGERGWLASALDERLSPALSAMHGRLEHAWTVAELAALTHQSRSAFAHRFTALVGRPPLAYLAERRMTAAQRLLAATAMPIGEVAGAVGFTSEPAFSRAFRRRFGQAPLAWRRQARSQAVNPSGGTERDERPTVDSRTTSSAGNGVGAGGAAVGSARSCSSAAPAARPIS